MILKKKSFFTCQKNGFTLIEAVVAMGIIITAGTFVVTGFNQAVQAITNSRSKVSATALASEKLEIIRNMPYDALGTVSGWPPGSIPSSETITRNNFQFIVETRIDYVDDPFDGNASGTIPGKPVDTVPNDYKKADVSVRWNRSYATPVLLTTLIVPNGLESASNTGSLLIQVFNASGQPVPLANIHITNNQVIPSININTTTDNSGNLQVLSLPPSLENYHIEATKLGYSADATYPVDPINLPHPVKPNTSIIAGAVTEESFAIDKVSSLEIKTLDSVCAPVPNIPLSIWGEKLIGTNPDTLKYSSEPPTNDQGSLLLSDLEWDNYTLLETSGQYDVSGIIPPVLLSILPDTSQTISLVLAPHTVNSLRLTIKDAGTETPITGANIDLFKTGFSASATTGFGFFEQNNWSGGSGQEVFIDHTKYANDDGNVDYFSTPGNISLISLENTFSFSEDFITDSYKDAQGTTANWDTADGQLKLVYENNAYLANGTAQSLSIGVPNGKITKATLTPTDTLNSQTVYYYLSANGGLNFEPVQPFIEHVFAATGSDLRWRAELATTDPAATPIVDSINITYSVTTYRDSGVLTSSSFDTGITSDFGALSWLPSSQIFETGPNSVKFQIATNNDNAAWEFFGPDGTVNTYYANSGTAINAIHNGNRYIRYKAFLSTENPAYSPIISGFKVAYTSACVPPGQVFFSDLDNSPYNLSISLNGYETLDTSVTVSGTTQAEYLLTPLP